MLDDSPILTQRDDIISIEKMMRCDDQFIECLAQIQGIYIPEFVAIITVCRERLMEPCSANKFSRIIFSVSRSRPVRASSKTRTGSFE